MWNSERAGNVIVLFAGAKNLLIQANLLPTQQPTLLKSGGKYNSRSDYGESRG